MSLTDTSDSVTVRWLGGLLALLIGPVLVSWASGFSPRAEALWLAGEGGGPSALSSGAPEHEQVKAALMALRDSLIAALLALAGVGLALSGFLMFVKGQVTDLTRLCLKASVLALLSGIVAGPIFGMIDPPITTTPASGAASGAALSPAAVAPAVAVPASHLIRKEEKSK